MKKHLFILTAVVLAMVLIVACGDDGSSMSQQDAAVVQTAVMDVAGEVQGDVMSQLGSAGTQRVMQDDPWTFNDDGSFSATLDGPNGGTVDVSGSGSMTDDSYSFTLTMTFHAYVTTASTGGEITLDGELELSYEGSATSYSVSYSGNIDASGAVSGSANFDYHVSMNGNCIEYSGSIGGVSFDSSYGC